MVTNETISGLSTLIGQQTDQLWSITMAVILAEIAIVCSFFKNATRSKRWRYSEFLLYVSIVSHAGSLFCGYLTKGALVEMVRAGAASADVFTEHYQAAAVSALLQFVMLAVGLGLFVIVFALKRTEVSRIILEHIK